MAERVVPGCRYDMVYVSTGEEFGPVEVLQKIVPHDGCSLYAVNADYRSQNRGNVWYYVVAASMREAKQIFKNFASWLTVFTVAEVTEGELAESILNDPSGHIIF